MSFLNSLNSGLYSIYKKSGQVKDSLLGNTTTVAPSVKINSPIANPNAPVTPAQQVTTPAQLPVSLPPAQSAIGAIAGTSTPYKSPYMTDPNAGHPTGNLSGASSAAASNAGQAQQVAQGQAMAGSSQVASTNVPRADGSPVPVPVDRSKLPSMSDPNAPHPTGDLGAASKTAAEKAGQGQESAQANVMAMASAAAARDAQAKGEASQPKPTPQPAFTPLTAPEATYKPGTDSKAMEAGGSALDAILAQMKDGTPSAAVQNAIQGNREIMSKATQAAARQTAKAVTSSGAIGQGTQNQAIEDLSNSAISALGTSELGNQQLISDEAQKVREQAMQAYESAKGREQQGTQFDASRSDQNKQFNVTAGQTQQTINNQASQFDRNAGQKDQEIANQSSQFAQNLASADKATMTNALERMSADNPVLAAKLQKYLMDGGKGDVGTFTPQEQQQISTYVADKKKTQGAYDSTMLAIANSIPGQIKSEADAAQAETDKKAAADNAQKVWDSVSKLPAEQPASDADFKTLVDSGKLPPVSPQNIPVGDEAVKTYLADNPSGLINVGGVQYKVVNGDSPTDGRVGKYPWSDGKTTPVTFLMDSKGNGKIFYDGQMHDAGDLPDKGSFANKLKLLYKPPFLEG